MTISTFADLKSQVATFLNRANLTAQIPYFVQLAETRIAYGASEGQMESDPLRIRAMEQSSYATFNAQKIQLPTGFLQQRRLYISGTPNSEIDYVTPPIFWPKYLSSTSGKPTEYTVEGENIVLGPTPDASYTGQILYYKKFTALSGDTDTNWLLTNAPGVYLYSTLAEAHRFARNMEQASAYIASFCGIVNSLNEADKMDRYASPWAAKADICTP